VVYPLKILPRFNRKLGVRMRILLVYLTILLIINSYYPIVASSGSTSSSLYKAIIYDNVAAVILDESKVYRVIDNFVFIISDQWSELELLDFPQEVNIIKQRYGEYSSFASNTINPFINITKALNVLNKYGDHVHVKIVLNEYLGETSVKYEYIISVNKLKEYCRLWLSNHDNDLLYTMLTNTLFNPNEWARKLIGYHATNEISSYTKITKIKIYVVETGNKEVFTEVNIKYPLKYYELVNEDILNGFIHGFKDTINDYFQNTFSKVYTVFYILPYDIEALDHTWSKIFDTASEEELQEFYSLFEEKFNIDKGFYSIVTGVYGSAIILSYEYLSKYIKEKNITLNELIRELHTSIKNTTLYKKHLKDIPLVILICRTPVLQAGGSNKTIDMTKTLGKTNVNEVSNENKTSRDENTAVWAFIVLVVIVLAVASFIVIRRI